MSGQNDMADQRVVLEKEGPVATLILNRPDKRNAIDEAMWQEIAKLATIVADDPSVKVMILRGADAMAFSAGADIAEFRRVHASPEEAHAYRDLVDRAYEAVANLRVPTIAMVRGPCFGGGCALSLCCDFRYADPTATFCIPPARLGLIYSLKETRRLADLVGPSKAKEMLMGAQVIDADEALGIGLTTRLFSSDELEPATLEFARRLTELSQATISAVKLMMGEILDGATGDTETSRGLVDAQFEGADYIEGRMAFLERRKPKFS